MTEGERLFLTVNYAFNYDHGHFFHLNEFDIITQFFEKRNNLEGFIDEDDDPRIEEGSDVAILMDRLYKAFGDRDIPGLVDNLLHEFEMYEVLAEYYSPLSTEGKIMKKELIENSKNFI